MNKKVIAWENTSKHARLQFIQGSCRHMRARCDASCHLHGAVTWPETLTMGVMVDLQSHQHPVPITGQLVLLAGTGTIAHWIHEPTN